MHIDSWKGEFLLLFCAWFHTCTGLKDTIFCVICLNFLLHVAVPLVKCLLSFESFIAAVSFLEISIAESSSLVKKYCCNVVAFGGKFSCQLCNDPRCWLFGLIYRYLLSCLCSFLCIILLAPFIVPWSSIFIGVNSCWLHWDVCFAYYFWDHSLF